jgi:hypothetical protein
VPGDESRAADAAAPGSAAGDAGDRAVVAERCAAQLLSGPRAASPYDAVHRLLAVQGQDPRGARLAIRARSVGLTAADVDRAMTVDRSLLITWLNRGTLHLVTAEDYWWLQLLTTPAMETAIARRLAQEGVGADEAETAIGLIDAALAADGPLTRAQLGDRVAAAGIRTKGQALVHLLAKASVRGLIVRGPMVGRQHAFVRVSDWLGRPPARFLPARFDKVAALAELARRYLAGHAPASERDLAKWRAFHSATAAAGSQRSPVSSMTVRTASPSSLPAAVRERLAGRVPPGASERFRRSRDHGCSAPSTRCCTAGWRGNPCLALPSG